MGFKWLGDIRKNKEQVCSYCSGEQNENGWIEMTREQLLAWDLSCNLRDQQQNALSPETDNVPPMCKEAGCPLGILWEFSQKWKIRYKSQHLSCFQILWVSVQFSSVSQSCPTLCDPMKRSMPGFRVHHQLPEFPQTHVHWVADAVQPSPVVPFSSCPQSFPISGYYTGKKMAWESKNRLYWIFPMQVG